MIKGYACVTELENRLEVSYEDLDVEGFGGMDYEGIYTFCCWSELKH